jgi:hypothetical protein
MLDARAAKHKHLLRSRAERVESHQHQSHHTMVDFFFFFFFFSPSPVPSAASSPSSSSSAFLFCNIKKNIKKKKRKKAQALVWFTRACVSRPFPSQEANMGVRVSTISLTRGQQGQAKTDDNRLLNTQQMREREMGWSK